MKKIISLMMALVMSLSLCVGAFAAENTATTAEEETAPTNVIQPRDYMNLTYTERVVCTVNNKRCVANISINYGVRDDESNESGYRIVSIGGVSATKVSGWTAVGDATILENSIAYRNNRQQADVTVQYEASTGSGYDTYTVTLTIDLND